MNFDILDDGIREEISQKAGAFLSPLLQGEYSNYGKLTLSESCRLEVLDLSSNFDPESSPDLFRRPTHGGEAIWHHQIKQSGLARFYARTVIRDDALPGKKAEILEVSESRLAKEFDAAISWLDSEASSPLLSELMTTSNLVRLLIAPRYNFFSFGLFGSEAPALLRPLVAAIPILVPAGEGGEHRGFSPAAADSSIIHPDDLLRVLMELPVFFGIRG